MIRQSNRSRETILGALNQAVPAFQDATDEVDEAAARVLGMNRTDMRWLGVLIRAGSMSPSQLAASAGLTRGAMTAALDRMERAGYVRRVRDAADRRGVRVDATDIARRKARLIYGPIAANGRGVLSRYTTAELAAVLRFLKEGRALQQSHVRRIRDLS